MIHRSGARSYLTVASPSLFVWQPPPNPLHSVFVCTGPYTTLPVLSNTANALFTTSTIRVGPTAAFVSGGALFTVNEPCGPEKPWPIPSKLFESEGAAAASTDDWTAGSAAVFPFGVGYLCCGCSFFVSSGGAGAGASLSSGADVSYWTACWTSPGLSRVA